MMNEKTLGQELVGAIEEALVGKEEGKIVRPFLDVSLIRKQLRMTQKEFASHYRINLLTLRKWEQKQRMPDTTSLAYLLCIQKEPKLIDHILNA